MGEIKLKEIPITKEKSKALQKEFREEILSLQNMLFSSDSKRVVAGNSDAFPLKHSFSEGIYVREMLMHKGSFVIGHIHRCTHTWFLLTGALIVTTERGTESYIAPCYVNAPEGAKRAIYAVEDTIFVNVHANPENSRDIDKLEREITAESFKEYDDWKKAADSKNNIKNK
mgnify:CR=1 FL=1